MTGCSEVRSCMAEIAGAEELLDAVRRLAHQAVTGEGTHKVTATDGVTTYVIPAQTAVLGTLGLAARAWF